jgi:hypothetical protein
MFAAALVDFFAQATCSDKSLLLGIEEEPVHFSSMSFPTQKDEMEKSKWPKDWKKYPALDDDSIPGYCRCSWRKRCFEHNQDCHPCLQAWNDGRAWAEEKLKPAMQASANAQEEKLHQLEAELIFSEASADAQAAAASHAAELKAEKKKAKKAAKKSKAPKKEKAAKKGKAEKEAAKKPKALRH